MTTPRHVRIALSRGRRVFMQQVENTFGMVRPMSRRISGRDELPAPVTNRLFEQIASVDLEAVAAKLSSDDRDHWARLQAGSNAWKRAAIHHSVHQGEKAATGTRLTSVAPPDDVHAMGRGSRAAGGSIYHADMIFGALELIGAEIPVGGHVFDFGCSSGRVIRVVKAYRPDLNCQGGDPNEGAIRWASSNLSDIEFFVSPLQPPLPIAVATLDCAFAISIWSHFGRSAAIAWLDEMHRILKPGALLIITVHSFGSVAYFASRKMRATVDMRAVLASMLDSGFAFIPVFARGGDWGIFDPEWGEAYMSQEWLLNTVTPRWEILLYRTSANEENQDLVVLRKRMSETSAEFKDRPLTFR